jgi:mRNA interferase HigB
LAGKIYFPKREFSKIIINFAMRILSKATLRTFWETYPDSRPSLEFWYDTNEVINHFRNADIVGNGRIVFNITQNKYRLIVKFEYERQLAFVRFIGTHKEYDKITDIQNI